MRAEPGTSLSIKKLCLWSHPFGIQRWIWVGSSSARRPPPRAPCKPRPGPLYSCSASVLKSSVCESTRLGFQRWIWVGSSLAPGPFFLSMHGQQAACRAYADAAGRRRQSLSIKKLGLCIHPCSFSVGFGLDRHRRGRPSCLRVPCAMQIMPSACHARVPCRPHMTMSIQQTPLLPHGQGRGAAHLPARPCT